MADDGLVIGEDGVTRCAWGSADADYRAYHDGEWGFPVSDDVRLFEKLSLEGFQAGLSWLTILRKREAFRQAFAGFDFARVAGYGERDVKRLLGDAGIVRHRGKIEAVINNAGRAVELVGSGGLAGALRVELRAQTARGGARSGNAAPVDDQRGVKGAGQGSEETRLALCRADDRLRVHAGHGLGQRSPRGV